MKNEMAKKNKKGEYTEHKNSEERVRVVERIEEIPGDQLFPQTQQIALVKEFDKPLVSLDEAIEAWNQYQDLINALIKTNDIVVVQGVPKAKKSGINKIARFFGYSVEIIRAYKEETEGPQGGKIITWRVWAKAIAPTGRFRVAGAACSSAERRFAHLEHDVYATAETRAKKRAIEELAGMGELELLEEDEEEKVNSETQIKEKTETIKGEERIEEYEVDGKKYIRIISADGTIQEGVDPNQWVPIFNVSIRRTMAGKGYSVDWKRPPTQKQIEFIKTALERIGIKPENAVFKLNNRADRKIREKRIEDLDYGDAWDICEIIMRKKRKGLEEIVAEVMPESSNEKNYEQRT